MNCIHDAQVTGTAAQITYQRFPDVIIGRVRLTVDQRPGRDQNPWGAETALDAAMLNDGLSGRFIRAQEYTGLSLQDAVAKAMKA